MPARPHKPRRAPLLIAVLLAGCHFESAGLGDEDAGPGAEGPAPTSATPRPRATAEPNRSSKDGAAELGRELAAIATKASGINRAYFMGFGSSHRNAQDGLTVSPNP